MPFLEACRPERAAVRPANEAPQRRETFPLRVNAALPSADADEGEVDGLSHHGGPGVAIGSRSSEVGLEEKDQGEEEEPEVIVLEEGQDDEDTARRPITVRAPKNPTQKERDEHEATHLPHQDWCEFCVTGRGRKKPHRKRNSKRKKG